MKEIRWGVLGAAKIALERVIPALQATPGARVVALASRTTEKARAAAQTAGIARAYGSYQELLDDTGVDAIYIPLPNHLHVPWSVRALEAGKHVLCEKPIALDAAEARQLIAARERTGRLIQEAVMVKTHPRWVGARTLVREGRLGELRAMTGFFSYYNVAPQNVRNQAAIGGGGLLDVGFYPITMSRFLFDAEPTRVIGLMERDPAFGTDRLTSAMLEFPTGQATFTCATQLSGHQVVDVFGTRGHLLIDLPWSMPSDRASHLRLDQGAPGASDGVQQISFPACDQWQVQCELFCDAIRGGGPAPVPIEDAIATMTVIDAIARSASSGRWEQPLAVHP